MTTEVLSSIEVDPYKIRTHSSSIGVKGRTIVPQAIRKALRVEEGDTILYLETPQGIVLTTRQALIDRLTGAFAKDDGLDLTQELIADRRAEAARERNAR